MNKEDIEKLAEEKYSIKEVVAYFLVGYKNAKDKKNFYEIIKSIIQCMIDIKPTKILEMIEDIELIADVILFWSINAEQMISYAYLLFKPLSHQNRKLKDEDIVSQFEVLTKLFSPDNAVEVVNEKINKNS
jgi:hypothetical protein